MLRTTSVSPLDRDKDTLSLTPGKMPWHFPRTVFCWWVGWLFVQRPVMSCFTMSPGMVHWSAQILRPG